MKCPKCQTENPETFKFWIGVPQCISINRLAIDFENRDQYQEAIELCEKVMSLGFKDNTKGGYQDRITN